MRAEEGDESLKDYAVEGEKALGRIKDAQHAGSPIGRIFRRITGIFRGDQGSAAG